MNLEYPIVSAVIPTRNRPGLVVRATVSALEQSFRGLEVIVVVDGPDEATLHALAEIRDPRLRVIALEESVGGRGSEKRWRPCSERQWVALLDDDDEWLPRKIGKQLAAALSSRDDRILVVSQFIERSPAREDVVRPRRLTPAKASISANICSTSSAIFKHPLSFVPESYFWSSHFARN